MYLEWTFIYLYIFVRNSYLAYLCSCIFWHRTNQLCVPPVHKLMVAVPIMTLKSISVCPSVHPSVRRSPIHPSHPIPPSARTRIHPSIHPYLSIYLLSIYRSGTEMSWYRNALVPKRLGAESSRDFFLGWCRNVLVPKRLGPNRLGAETTWCRNVCKSKVNSMVISVVISVIPVISVNSLTRHIRLNRTH